MCASSAHWRADTWHTCRWEPATALASAYRTNPAQASAECSVVASIVDGVNRPSAAASELYGAQCFEYDDFNRSAAAWTEFASNTETFTCEWAAPEAGETWWSEGPGGSSLAGTALGGTGHAGTAYATEWSYSDSGRIAGISNLVAADTQVARTFAYTDPDAFHAVKGVESQTTTVVSDDFATNTLAGGFGWATDCVESGDDSSASSGLVSADDAMVAFTGVVTRPISGGAHGIDAGPYLWLFDRHGAGFRVPMSAS
ncbi:MAG: hypothetical protein CVT64_06955 [Actinobacteria bacterium HGW-Actinobacteria-4]|nr:MAG: hypothetical protein CVT64_06955 [Actinobacteria bacterium HGW-Actinobacteria-4]